MKYLCLIYDDEQTLAEMPKAKADAFMGEYFAFTEAIRESGYLLSDEALQPVQTATTVRLRNGRTSVTDGPFAETKGAARTPGRAGGSCRAAPCRALAALICVLGGFGLAGAARRTAFAAAPKSGGPRAKLAQHTI